jgi:YVTN family beta-propeller protein
MQVIAIGAGFVAMLLASAPAAAACVGDCNDDGQVTVDELLLGVNIALGNTELSRCPVFDSDSSGAVEVYDLIVGVNHALSGCPVTQVLRRASKSSTIAIADDDSVVVMTNPDDDSISIFTTATNQRIAKVATGDEPSSVVILPDSTTAFVANRAAATIVRVININTADALISAPVEVGSEPTGLALSPTGSKLFVAEWAEGRVSVFDTRTLTRLTTIDAPLHPRGLAVTNDGDTDDNDETLILTEFYGEPNTDVTGCPNATSEVCDTGRIGRIRRYNVSDYAPQPPILLQPIDSGFVPDGSAAGTATVETAPNQLSAVATRAGKIYVTSVSASPQGPIKFNANVFPVVYVGDLATGAEDRSNVGTANLAKLAEDAIQPAVTGKQRFFLQDIVDLDFLGNTAYVVSRAADTVQRVTYGGNGIVVGTPDVPQIDLIKAGGPPACQNPIGIVTSDRLLKGYVNCWITRRLAVIDFTTQTVETAVQSTDLPAAGTIEDRIRKGARFYFTGRARWSKGGDGYSSCGSCHPDGLSDNITWAFPAGPRQATSMDGSFSHGDGPQKQRIFNWTAIFDEIHDFERNTRAVSGGLGAITTSATNECGTIAKEQPVDVPADGLGASLKEIQDTTAGICVKDWDDIDEFIKTIRPPRALRDLDPEAVARGAALFSGAGSCTTCHGGNGWTVSRLFFEPAATTNAELKITPFTPPSGDAFFPSHSVQISPQPAGDDNTGAVIPPNEVACVLREVATFGNPVNDAATDAIEKKVDGSRAEGRGGFNVPSLYGLAVGAPYLHHGQARTLRDVFTDGRWIAHLKAGDAGFNPSSAQIEDLIAFLLSIDAETTEFTVPTPFDACPAIFPTSGPW